MKNSLAGCGKTRSYFGTIPQRLKPGLILQNLRCGWKPHPFKSSLESGFFRSLLERSFAGLPLLDVTNVPYALFKRPDVFFKGVRQVFKPV